MGASKEEDDARPEAEWPEFNLKNIMKTVVKNFPIYYHF